ncbi:MAG: T9SS type A sorting domain-containing protein, partial [Bacteroidetes bacterium]
YGGNADGFSFNTLTQTVCPPLASTNIYYGGNADGFSFNTLTQTLCPPLPVELLYFNAECDNRRVVLNWVTASEQNAAYFSLERSADAVNYFLIGTLAASGNSSVPVYYPFTDSDPLSFAYYRLTETDFNGASEVFPPIVISCSQYYFEIYPNIGSGNIFIRSEKTMQISIGNVLGEMIYSAEINIGINAINLNTQSNGVYFLTVKTEKEFITQKIIISK